MHLIFVRRLRHDCDIVIFFHLSIGYKSRSTREINRRNRRLFLIECNSFICRMHYYHLFKDEIEYDRVQNMVYLDWCLKESLRMDPIAAL